MSKSKIFIVMPAYNAGATIEKVFARIPGEIRQSIDRYVVVDDGSTDDTAAALARLCREFPNLVFLKNEKNRGYGATEKILLAYALKEGAETAVLLHADGQYSPEKLSAMLAPFENGEADLVQGSRMLSGGALRGGMPLYKYVANKCLTAIENVGFGMKLAEYHSGYMAYSRKMMLAVPFHGLSDSFDFDLEMIVCAKIISLKIREVAIPTIYAGEKSHLNPIKYGFDVLAIVRRYRQGRYHKLLERGARK
jgi:glycosyltransferase involved in cell wall biosynthesis